MGGVNVKNTMIERLLQIVAPHPCFGCHKIGSILCQDCKYNITHEPFLGCILCGTPQSSGICSSHDSPIVRAFTVSSRTGALETTINSLKFNNTKQAARPLAELLHAALPILPDDIQVVSIPTVSSHIRQRGYDHVDLIIRQLNTLRPISIQRVLRRRTSTTQHTVLRRARQRQAEEAFQLDSSTPVKGKTILLFDDIVTTGSTLSSAAKLLNDAGATVWVATLAYQPLD